jgi:phosphoribosyl 1,2-cyclic phosphodiesterase
MKLKILGSNSKGNCYILEGEQGKLILESGINFNKVKKALDFKLNDVVGCLVTHDHKDHLGYIDSILISGIQVYASKGTIGELKHHNINYVHSRETFNVGEFKILAFDSIHDTEEPLNFLIENKITSEKLLFITDSAYCKYKFKNIDYLLVECNFKESILQENVDKGILNNYIANRIRNTHMELETVKKLVSEYKGLKKVILIHLSAKNSDPQLFKDELEKTTGINTYIAMAGDYIAL